MLIVHEIENTRTEIETASNRKFRAWFHLKKGGALNTGAIEMTEQVKVFATEPGHLSSSPTAHMVEGTN